MKSKLLLAVLALCLAPLTHAQTPHGVNLNWVPPSPVGGSGTVQGYYVFRCFGVCTTATGTFTAISPLVTSATKFLDAATGSNAPNLATTYTYAVLTVDSNGNESAYSTVATVTTPAAWPTNPSPPSGLTAQIQ